MDYINNPERERVLTLAHEASTLEEVESAAAALRRWMQEHPQDRGIRDAFEPLSHLEDYLASAPTIEEAATVSA